MEQKGIEEIIAALPQPGNDPEVMRCVEQQTTLVTRVEAAVEEAAAADRAQHEAERQLGMAATGKDERHLAAAQDRLDAALARRAQLVVRARALANAAAEVEHRLAAARAASVGRCRAVWDEGAAGIKGRHAAAVAELQACELAVAMFGRALTVMTRLEAVTVPVKFSEGTGVYRAGETAAFPAPEAAAFVRDGVADYADAWRAALAGLLDPGFEARRAALRAGRVRPTTPSPHLAGGRTPSALPKGGSLNPTGLG